MTQRELIAIVSRLTFFASDYNYHMAKGNEEKANNALLRLDAVFSMAYDFKENPIKSAVTTDITPQSVLI